MAYPKPTPEVMAQILTQAKEFLFKPTFWKTISIWLFGYDWKHSVSSVHICIAIDDARKKYASSRRIPHIHYHDTKVYVESLLKGCKVLYVYLRDDCGVDLPKTEDGKSIMKLLTSRRYVKLRDEWLDNEIDYLRWQSTAKPIVQHT